MLRAIVLGFTFVDVLADLTDALVAVLAVASEALGQINAHFGDVIAGVGALLAFVDELQLALARGLAAAAVMLLALALVAAGCVHAVGVGVALGSFLRAFIDLVALPLAIAPVAIFALARVAADLVATDGVLVAVELLGRAFVDVVTSATVSGESRVAFTAVRSRSVDAFRVDVALVGVLRAFVNVDADAVDLLVAILAHARVGTNVVLASRNLEVALVRAQAFVDVLTLPLCRVSSIVLVSALADAFVSAIGVEAVRIDASVQVLGAAFVDVIAPDAVALVARLALARVAAGGVEAVRVLIALMLSGRAFVEIVAFSDKAVAAVSLVALAEVAALQVEAPRVLVALVLLERAFVHVQTVCFVEAEHVALSAFALLLLGLGIQCALLGVVRADLAVAGVVSDAFARVRALRVEAGGSAAGAVVLSNVAFVDIQASLADCLVSLFARTSVAARRVFADLLDVASVLAQAFVNVFAFVVADLLESGLALALVVERNVLAGGSRLVALVHAQLALVNVLADLPAVSS